NTVGSVDPLSTGINAGVFNTRISPALVGESDTVSSTVNPGVSGLGTRTGVANTWIAGTTGISVRPLNPTDEFRNNDIDGATATSDNVYIKAATISTVNNTVNSLVINGGDVTVTDGTTLTNTSGAVLFVTSNT